MCDCGVVGSLTSSSFCCLPTQNKSRSMRINQDQCIKGFVSMAKRAFYIVYIVLN